MTSAKLGRRQGLGASSKYICRMLSVIASRLQAGLKINDNVFYLAESTAELMDVDIIISLRGKLLQLVFDDCTGSGGQGGRAHPV